MSEEFRVFFSWQSDTNRQHGQRLIREALELAGEKIGADPTTPYRISIYSDTEGESGLCNIPETILRRLRESDAVVSDLTFVAKTTADEPKHCSNPNVLFELGYAFASIGPERLICVLNEAHGESAKQIFDLAHHRRPITFESPNEKKTRKETTAALAIDLEQALRGVLKLGLVGGYGGDDEIQHQRNLSEMQAIYETAHPKRTKRPKIRVTFRPALFRPKRWPDAGILEQVVREVATRTDRFRLFPPQQKGTAPMDWGIYNDTYFDPWALTYAGLFWAEFAVDGRQPLTISERDLQVSPEPPENPRLAEGQWISAEAALSSLSQSLQFARNLSGKLFESERVQIEVSAENLSGRWLHFQHGETMGPCRAPRFSRDFSSLASEFHESCRDYFVSTGKDFTDLFIRCGRNLTVEEVSSYWNLAGDISAS